jgi:hypothetical protein
MFLGDDNLICKAHDAVWARSTSGVILTPDVEVMETPRRACRARGPSPREAVIVEG